MRVASIVQDSIVDGPGIRLTVFVQGCPHACEGCHNPATHDFAAGSEASVGDILLKFKKNPLMSGLTLSGGEPFCQARECAELAGGARALKKSVWVYSGWTFEELFSKNDPDTLRLLRECDVLVDGRFALERRTLSLAWRGSSNQRLIDLPASLLSGRAMELEYE